MTIQYYIRLQILEDFFSKTYMAFQLIDLQCFIYLYLKVIFIVG
jgi:hypothetical protein